MERPVLTAAKGYKGYIKELEEYIDVLEELLEDAGYDIADMER